MPERALHPRVVTIGRALAERVPERRRQLHSWVSERLVGQFCTSDQYDTTVYVELTDLVADPDTIETALANTLPGSAAPDAIALIDLTANPYDLLPDPLLHSVASFASSWCATDASRISIVLIPVIPPRELSLLWPPIINNQTRGTILVVASDGSFARRSHPGSIVSDTLEEYASRQTDLRGSLEARLRIKNLRRLGHFKVESPTGVQCARFFFDASLGIDEVARLIVQKIGQRITPVFSHFVLLTHGPRSSWLHEAGLTAALELGTRSYDISVPGRPLPIESPTVGVVIFDVVNTGRTWKTITGQLRESGIPLATRTFTVMADGAALRDDGDINLERFIDVDADKVTQSQCSQCDIGLPHTDPLNDQHAGLRAFDAWHMFLHAPWKREPYGAPEPELFPSMPDMAHIFMAFGDYLAYKIEILLDSLNLHGELVFVCPDESNINILMEKLGPRLHDRFVAVQIRREDFDATAPGAPGSDRGAWRRQLEHLAAARSASVVIMDEFNASSRTATELIKLVRSFKIEPIAYLTFVNRSTVDVIEGVAVHSLYRIPSPRRSQRAAAGVTG